MFKFVFIESGLFMRQCVRTGLDHISELRSSRRYALDALTSILEGAGASIWFLGCIVLLAEILPIFFFTFD